MGITGNKKLTGMTTLVAIVGSLFGLTVAGCSDSGDKTPAVLGGKVVYEYTLQAKTELPTGVSYITYTGYNKNGEETYKKVKVTKAETVVLGNVPEGTTRMDAVYFDGTDKELAFGVNTFASISKSTETTVSTPSYVAVEKLPEAMEVVVEPAESVIGVDDTVAYKAYRLFDNGVDEVEIKDEIGDALKSSDAKVADFAEGADANVITGLAFGETEVGLADGYKFMGQDIPVTAAKLTVLDGELQSIEVMPVNDKAICSTDDELVIVNNYLNNATENSWVKKYVEDYKTAEGGTYELQSSQMKVVATYMVGGVERTADVTKNATFKLAPDVETGAPFVLDNEVNGLVNVATTATTASTATLTATYKDIIDGKTEKEDTLGLAAGETDVVLTAFDGDTAITTSLQLTIDTKKTLSVKAMPQVITEDGPVALVGEAVDVNEDVELSVIPQAAIELVTVNGLDLTANDTITSGNAYLKMDLDGNTNEADAGKTDIEITTL